jgi:hypothetical protein
MASIEILRGYSASGKSTYARESGKIIVSRDSIRAMLKGNPKKTVGPPESEVLVTKIQEAAVRAAIGQEVKPSPGKESKVFTPYVPDTSLPRAVIFDIDGTLAHMNGRSPYDPSKYHEDTVDDLLRDLIWHYDDAGWQIILLSGRDDTYRDTTQQWLWRNGVPTFPLYMRPSEDKRSDDIVKSELFDEHVAPFYYVTHVFDDRDRVVKMWRAKGVICYQVADGNF